MLVLARANLMAWGADEVVDEQVEDQVSDRWGQWATGGKVRAVYGSGKQYTHGPMPLPVSSHPFGAHPS